MERAAGRLGGALATSRSRSLAALAVGIAALAADQLGPWFPSPDALGGGALTGRWFLHGSAPRIALGMAASIVLLALARGDRESVGLRLVPAQPWRWWLKATLALGALLGVAIALAWLALNAWGRPFEAPRLAGAELLDFARQAVLIAPLTEEPLYRLALCVPLAALAGERAAIAASGLVFAWLHVRYGTAAPDNVLAGFALGWAFVKSRSLVVPVLLHALGNACLVALWSLWPR